MEIGTATFKISVPGEPVRRYSLVCTLACAHRTLHRAARNLANGALLDMQWHDAAGQPGGGGSTGRWANGHLQHLPAYPASVRFRMQAQDKSFTVIADERGNVYAPIPPSDAVQRLFKRAWV